MFGYQPILTFDDFKNCGFEEIEIPITFVVSTTPYGNKGSKLTSSPKNISTETRHQIKLEKDQINIFFKHYSEDLDYLKELDLTRDYDPTRMTAKSNFEEVEITLGDPMNPIRYEKIPIEEFKSMLNEFKKDVRSRKIDKMI